MLTKAGSNQRAPHEGQLSLVGAYLALCMLLKQWQKQF